jgi:DNA-binding NarL/FixJ family response regulator
MDQAAERSNRKRYKGHPRKKIKLTRREEQVLACLTAGRFYKEISTDLSVTLDTSRFHAKGIYKKLGVRSRVEAVLWFVQQGNWNEQTTTQRCR